MKKHWIYPLAFVLGIGLCTTACGDDEPEGETTEQGPGGGEEGGGGGEEGGGGGSTELPVATAEQAQAKLDQVGKALIQKVEVQRLEPVISLLDYCTAIFGMEDEAEMTPGVSDGNAYGMRSLMQTLRLGTQGDIARLASKRAIGDVYEISQLHGEWAYDDNTGEWEQIAGPGEREAAFYRFNYDGQEALLTLQGSGQVFDFVKTDSLGNEGSETIKIPANVSCGLSLGGQTMLHLTVNTTACSYAAKEYAASATLGAADYTVKADMDYNNASATVSATLFSGREQLASIDCTVDGSNLADIDLIESGYFDAESNLHNGVLTYNLLDEVELQVGVNNQDGFVEAFDYESYYYYSASDTVGSLESVREAARQEAQQAADIINRDLKAQLALNGSEYTVPVTWQPTLDDYTYDDPMYGYSYGYWYNDPVLNFADGATYTFEQYFTVARFESLIQVYNELAQQFKEM